MFTLMDDGRGELITDAMDYVFQDTAPVPEPGTMLLLGSGLAATAAARRRRHRASAA